MLHSNPLDDDDDEIISESELKSLSQWLDGSTAIEDPQLDIDGIKKMMDKVFADEANFDTSPNFKSKPSQTANGVDDTRLQKSSFPFDTEKRQVKYSPLSVINTHQDQKLELAHSLYVKRLKMKIWKAWRKFVLYHNAIFEWYLSY